MQLARRSCSPRAVCTYTHFIQILLVAVELVIDQQLGITALEQAQKTVNNPWNKQDGSVLSHRGFARNVPHDEKRTVCARQACCHGDSLRRNCLTATKNVQLVDSVSISSATTVVMIAIAVIKIVNVMCEIYQERTSSKESFNECGVIKISPIIVIVDLLSIFGVAALILKAKRSNRSQLVVVEVILA